ncbi:crossover junction endonuclease EME1 isoform X1 [Neophocaena asiaeorientalis asiaeorientalis]|uniref:Structure-specific endonuclease subunit EME1 n=1 Tax=Neophocaena asiaeorientalis asiaeorientalis TaxID=1706337 RepID=A0A341B8U2_NEOAA|nr:crossover junction endonuclease EME1 isoform X1 [Neophocaena asiaeorientalis asiaeorientalis]XP_024599152.1 crossover junction endonuclease EME1 isoform X1 [Neophocaena asiaeorientalis asiaeorientalis]XP_024599160.1 crossover junction endonuclease EME1 isoform X1 [Neophocaena asiaeorientalis asiaeorientalis]
MAVEKSSLALDSSESESEELPTFAFLKKQPSSTKRRQPQKEEKIVVVDTSDSEASCPPSPKLRDPPPVPETAETVTQTEPVRVLSSGSEDEEEFAPLAERLTCKFLTHKQLSPEGSSSPVKRVLDHQNNEGASRDWQNQPFTKIRDIPLCDTSERCASSNKDPVVDSPCHQLPACQTTCSVQSNSVTVTKTNAEVPPPQKRTKPNQKVQRRGSQGCQQRGQAGQKESTQRQQERKKKAALADRLKAQRPEECLKHTVVLLDPVLLQMEGGGQLLGALQSMECCCVIEAPAVPCSITWRRAGSTEDGEEDWVEEPMVLVLLQAEAFVSMVYNFKQGSLGSTEEGKKTLRSFVTDITARTAGKALSLVIVDPEKCFRAPNPPRRRKQGVANGEQAKEKKQRQPEANTAALVTRVDMEEALVDLQLHTEAQARIVQSWKELADLACTFTKAVAEAPFKKLRDQAGFSFCPESDWAGGAKVDRSGRGLAVVWRRQVQQLNRVSLEMASAVVDAYPSPQLLIQAYKRCSSEQERQNLLADIQVRRGEGVTATSRRLGPELSRRIYLQMTALQPDLSLDSAD